MEETEDRDNIIKECGCLDWRENIGIINGMLSTLATHGIQYRGKLFNYCPWCGKLLVVRGK